MPSVTGANCATAKKSIRGILLEGEALRGRLAGKSYSTIGRELGVSKGAAHAAVVRALAKTKQRNAEAVDMLREIELAHINELTASCHSQALSGDLHAIETCIKLSSRRSQLAGLNAPTESTVMHGQVEQFMTREQKEAAVRDRIATLLVASSCPQFRAKHGLNSERLPPPAEPAAAEVLADA